MAKVENFQVRKNLIFNILSLLANIGIGILYTPYLVNSLGLIAYGIIPLALVINQFINVVSGSLTSALTRFYSIAIQKEENDDASKYLSTSIIVILTFIVILMWPLWLLVNNIEHIFTIPIELLAEAKLLFSFTILSFFCSLISSIFNITLYAHNRLDYLSIIKIIRVSGKLLFVLLLFSALDTNIAYVGLANLITEVVLLVFSIIVFLRFSKGTITLNLRNYNSDSLKAISLMSMWVIIQQVGDTSLYRIDTMLLNIFWTSRESGILGAFTELGNYTIIIASVVGSLFGPLILIAFSKDDHEEVKTLALDRSLSVGVIVAVMIGGLGGFSPIILKAWLGSSEFIEYSNWLVLKLTLVPFYSAAGVLAFVSRAWNKVRFPALITIFLGIANFLILYFIAKQANGNLMYVDIMLIISMIMGITQSYILYGLYFSHIYKNTRRIIWINFVKISITLITVGTIGFLLTPFLMRYSSLLALLVIMIICLFMLIISLKIVLNKEQQKGILNLIAIR